MLLWKEVPFFTQISVAQWSEKNYKTIRGGKIKFVFLPLWSYGGLWQWISVGRVFPTLRKQAMIPTAKTCRCYVFTKFLYFYCYFYVIMFEVKKGKSILLWLQNRKDHVQPRALKKFLFQEIKPPIRVLVFAAKRWSKPVFLAKFHAFSSFFSFLAQKPLKMHISTSIWSAHHPNTFRNTQHPSLKRSEII